MRLDATSVRLSPMTLLTDDEVEFLRAHRDELATVLRGESSASLSPVPVGDEAIAPPRNDEREAAQPSGQGPAPGVPTAVSAVPPKVGPTAPGATTNDDVWTDIRGNRRVPIARIDTKKTDEFLELVRRHAMRRAND